MRKPALASLRAAHHLLTDIESAGDGGIERRDCARHHLRTGQATLVRVQNRSNNGRY